MLDCFVIPVNLLLQLNIVRSRLSAFIKPNHHLPVFCKVLFQAWFKLQYITGTNMDPDYSEVLQRPVCFNSVTKFEMKAMRKWYPELEM